MKQEQKMIGIIVVTNVCSIWILECESDYVKFSWNGGRVCTSQIRYDEEGEAYFMSGRTKWYLNQAIRMNR